MRSKGECSPADMRIGDWSIGNRIDKGGNVNVRHRDGSKDVFSYWGISTKKPVLVFATN